MSEHLRNLNEKQREAVLHKDGPILIVAGAGAGKTRVIVYRIFNLIKSGIDPEKILAITFTNKASGEMKERIFSLLGVKKYVIGPLEHPNLPFVSTFHSLGVYIMRNHYDKLGVKKNFTILDRNDSVRQMKNSIKETGYDPKEWEPRRVLNAISKFKNKGISLSDISLADANDFYEKTVIKIWTNYEKNIRKENSFDFDDLLVQPVKLLKENPEILKKYKNKWSHIHVDEYQDTNDIQNEFVKLLLSKEKNICVVGDGDQTIYTWRDANMNNILDFDKEYKNCKVVLLEKNYRSTKTILAVANEIIKKNKVRKEKNLYTDNKDGSKIKLFSAFDEIDEADFIAERARKFIEEKTRPQDIAIFYRTNFQSRALEEAFINYSIPYQILGTRFFDRKEVKDILSYIKAAMDPESITDLKRIINVPPRGIGKVTLLKIFSNRENELSPKMKERIYEFRKLLSKIKNEVETKVPSEVIKFVIKQTGLVDYLVDKTEDGKERHFNMLELSAIGRKYDSMSKPEGIEKLIEDAALAADQDALSRKNNSVKLMTIHASKGLEFKNVFITGLEDGLFPQKINGDDLDNRDKEEERRLFYVAITRAEENLFLSYAHRRSIFGEKCMNIPSEFLTDISEEFIESVDRESLIDSSERIKTVYLD